MLTSRWCLITGAGGFVGRRLATAIAAAGASLIVCVDVRFGSDAPGVSEPTKLVQVRADIRSASELDAIFQQHKPDVVFHVASFGMSGPAQLQEGVVRSINVGGTQNLIDACVKHACSALVYVSTYNVVFNGCTIVNGREADWPVLPAEKHVDPCKSPFSVTHTR